MEDTKMENSYTDNYKAYRPKFKFSEDAIRKLRPEDIQLLSEDELKALTKHEHFDKISLDQIVTLKP